MLCHVVPCGSRVAGWPRPEAGLMSAVGHSFGDAVGGAPRSSVHGVEACEELMCMGFMSVRRDEGAHIASHRDSRISPVSVVCDALADAYKQE